MWAVDRHFAITHRTVPLPLPSSTPPEKTSINKHVTQHTWHGVPNGGTPPDTSRVHPPPGVWTRTEVLVGNLSLMAQDRRGYPRSLTVGCGSPHTAGKCHSRGK